MHGVKLIELIGFLVLSHVHKYEIHNHLLKGFLLPRPRLLMSPAQSLDIYQVPDTHQMSALIFEDFCMLLTVPIRFNRQQQALFVLNCTECAKLPSC